MREMEIHAVAGINESNQKSLQALLEGYRRMLFPGVKTKDTSSEMDDAKKALAEEAKRMYVMKPLSTSKSSPSKEEWLAAAQNSPGLSFLAARELRERAMEEQSYRERLAKSRRRHIPKADKLD